MNRNEVSGITVFFLLIQLSLGYAQDNENITRISAIAKKPSVILPNDKPKLEFDFSGFKATLRSNGEMSVEGAVSHSRIRCANYAVGLRFGHGNPACTNVEWLTEDVYLTSKRHCNSARLEHSGFMVNETIGARVGEITCAQRVLRCTGACD